MVLLTNTTKGSTMDSELEMSARNFARAGGRDALADLARVALETYGLTKESWIKIPEGITGRDELGPAIRKLLVDEARAENQRRYAQDVNEIRNSVREERDHWASRLGESESLTELGEELGVGNER